MSVQAVASTPLRKTDFDYHLPPERIAQMPVTPRDHSRLMVLERKTRTHQHRRFHEVGAYLRPGDVLVLNATRVFPARLRGRKKSGGKAELLLLSPESGSRWRVLVRGISADGAEILFPEGLSARLEQRLSRGEWIVCFSRESVREYLESFGEMPLPPYIKRSDKDPEDHQAYQTVYAREEGSIAAPTAGFHFTPGLLSALRSQGIRTIEIVLHVGWGTFRPVRAENVEQHVMLPETYSVSAQAAGELNSARQENRRVIAVGTTAVRTLESIYSKEQDRFQAGRGETELFIYPGYSFKAVDALITNFHLPHSTPLLLACAFFGERNGGSEQRRTGITPTPRSADPFSLRDAYQAAITEGYRFYSYGDAMFIQ